jgi:hypothetical protein
MPEDEGPSSITLVHQTNEMLLRQVEDVSARIRSLSVATAVVSGLLGAAYAFQLALPFMGVTAVTVSANDPAFMAAVLGLLLLDMLWLYVILKNYIYISRLGRHVKDVRRAEEELMRKHGLEPPGEA